MKDAENHRLNMKLRVIDLGMERAGAVFQSILPPQRNLDELTDRSQTCLGLRSGDHGGRNGERGSQAAPDSCLSPDSPLQAQTRAALLRVLQEDEEHWGSPEDQPSSLAQDVCEVGGGEEAGISRTMRGWESGTSPLLTPSCPHP